MYNRIPGEKINIEHTKTNEILIWFEAISKIPRPSKHEQAIRNWLLDWVRENRFG
jgi:di/tripeptidase